jgi:hypothetical protein
VNVGIVNDFSETEFAAIGRLVWSFTVLEHELARAAMKLRVESGLVNNTQPVDAQIVKVITGSLKGRFDSFVAAMKAADHNSENGEWIMEAEAKFKDGLNWRDRVCHGKWDRHEDGRLTILFHNRESIESEREVVPEPVSVEELGLLAETTLGWAIEIARKAGTVGG